MPAYAFEDVVPVVDPTAFVHPTAVLIGDVILGPGVYVAPGVSIRGDMGRILIGANSNIQDCVVLHGFPGTDTLVGAYGHIGHGAIIHGCVLKDNVLVGMNAVVMDFATVGNSAIIGACAFVKTRQEIPPRTLAMGSPARVIRDLSDEEIDWKSQGTAAYMRLCEMSFRSMRECKPLTAPEAGRKRIEHPTTVPLADFRRQKKR